MSKEFNEEVLLAEVHDAFGRVRVVEMGEYRFLEFGDAVEQSCVFTADPAWLEYDYTRGMLLGALLHESAETALFLGLGAGNLTQCCLKFLGLTDDPRLTIRIGDAMTLLATAETADLIFLDLYTDTGPAAGHLAWKFLEDCQHKLNSGGWLVINQWGTDGGKPLGAALLRGLFHRHYWEIPVKEGNVILLIPASLEQQLDTQAVTARCEELAPRLGYSLQSLLDAIRPAS